MFLNIKIYYILIALTTIIMSGNNAFASHYQVVKILTDDDSLVKSGERIVVYATYNVTNGEKVTGIGIQIHYNSQKLQLVSIDSFYAEGDQGSVQKNDDYNDDNDTMTDRIIVMAWSSLGGNSWPWKELPIELVRMTFIVPNEATPGRTWLNVTATSTPGDYSFDGRNLQVNINTQPNLDINNDGFFNMNDVLQTLQNLSRNN